MFHIILINPANGINVILCEMSGRYLYKRENVQKEFNLVI